MSLPSVKPLKSPSEPPSGSSGELKKTEGALVAKKALIRPGEPEFAPALLAWGETHGRVGLAWQCQDPYRVWVSEIMLQQTQVETVKGYFDRFMSALPSLESLAKADEQTVLSLWAGLGYYQRARNLQKGARLVMEKWGGVFPQQADKIQELPGVGPSTAAAISSICFQERAAILDGNVQRALGRVFGVKEDLATATGQREYWALARRLVPDARAGLYTQSIMDLGATVCLPKKPECERCPFKGSCVALLTGEINAYPMKSKKNKPRPAKSARWLICTDGVRAGVVKNEEEKGVWRQLWTFPLASEGDKQEVDAQIKHVFSHYDLTLSASVERVSPSELDQRALSRGWRVEALPELAQLAIPQPMRWALELAEGPACQSVKIKDELKKAKKRINKIKEAKGEGQ